MARLWMVDIGTIRMLRVPYIHHPQSAIRNPPFSVNFGRYAPGGNSFVFSFLGAGQLRHLRH